MNAVTVELLKQAVALGIPAEYVLFDSWFSSPKMFWQLKKLGLDSVGMLKQTKKVYYRYRGRLYDVKGLYERLAATKMRRKADYIYSSVVEATYQGHTFPIRLVYVTKRGSKEKYLVLATTQYKLHPQEIIQLYGRRWQSIDDRTLGDLFYLMNEALPDLAFEEALVCLLTALKEVKAEISATVEQILDNFIKLLPVFMQKQLLRTA